VQGGEGDLESQDKGATSSGQWEAIYCYGHVAAPVATAANSWASTVMLIMGGRSFLIVRVAEWGIVFILGARELGFCDAKLLFPAGPRVAGEWRWRKGVRREA
jgi:hypothetical protein